MPCSDEPCSAAALWEDQELAGLRKQFRSWEIWYVLCYPNSISWCARLSDEPVSRFIRNTPGELAAAIEAAILRTAAGEAESGHDHEPGQPWA